jgi:hypothetical protein
VVSNDQIIGAFADWIRHSRPKEFQRPRNDASRENVTAAFLKRLAVMRLLHNCSHQDALDLAQRHGLKLPKQQSNALVMRKHVRDDIPLLFQSQAFEANMGTPLIPATEHPRSWNTFSERRRSELER